MAIIRKTRTDDYVIVHHVYGDKDVIDFLRMTSHTIINRLFFDARSNGAAEFAYRNQEYILTWTHQDLYSIEQVEDSSAGAG